MALLFRGQLTCAYCQLNAKLLIMRKVNANGHTLNLFLLGLVLALAASAKPTDSELAQLAEIRAKAEKGDPHFQLELGQVFESARFQMQQDYAEAAKWYAKSAEQNLAEAQDRLAICYSKGQGVVKNEVLAVEWFRK